MKKQFFLNLMRGIAVVVFCLTGFISMQAGTVLAPFGQLSKQPWQAKYSNYTYNNWYYTDYDDSSWNDISGPISSTNDGLLYYATQWQESHNCYCVRRHFNVNSLDQDIYALYVTHDNQCTVYLNGRKIYDISDYDEPLKYNKVYFPKEMLKIGDNLLAVRVYDPEGHEDYMDFGIYGEDLDWVSVELATPGTLGQEVLYQVNMLSDVKFLRVKGAMNGNDWTTIKNMANLLGTDLSQATATEVPNKQFRNRSDFCYMSLPKGLKAIGDEAFYGTYLGNISIPASVTSIGQRAFYENATLSVVDIASNSALTSIGESAFYECKRLKSISLPNGITKLEEGVFGGCSSLESVVLPPALNSIGSNCFRGTSSLKSIDFPQTLTTIYSGAFSGCGLESVVLPVNLSYLGDGAFYDCRSLKNLVLPATPNVKSSSSWTGYYSSFNYCTSLEKVICLSATPPAIYSNPFSYVDRSKVTLVVPAFAVVDYKLSTYWHEFGSIIEGAETEFLNIGSTLTLTNNRRPAKKVDVLLAEGGSLIVGGNAPFEVGALTFTVNTPNKSFGKLLNSTPAMTADQVTTRFYARSNRWYFITPLHDVNVNDVSHGNAEASFIFRYYNAQNRAVNGPKDSWQNLTDNTLKAKQGYIFQTNRDGWITMPATISGKDAALAYDDVATVLKTYNAPNAADANWNYVGNPYPCYYDTYYMDFAAPITVYDYNNWTYRAYSPIDDDYVLCPMEAFFVQKPANLAQILFPKEGRQMKAEVDRPARIRKVAGNARQLFDIQVGDGTYSDQTRLVVNSEATTAYEPARDATKFLSNETTAPQIYTIDEAGNQLAINERPLNQQNSVALGIIANQPGTYTISLVRGHGNLILTDIQTGQATDLSLESYTFTINEAGHINQRFTLSMGSDITDINMMSTNDKETNDAVYDLQGRKLSEGQVMKGVYLKNGKKYMVK